MEERFYIDGEVIPSIVEKPVKSLGKWYNSALNEVAELREFIAVWTFARCPLVAFIYV